MSKFGYKCNARSTGEILEPCNAMSIHGNGYDARFYLRIATMKETLLNLTQHPRGVFKLIRAYLRKIPLTIEIKQKNGTLIAVEIPKFISKILHAQQWYCVEWSSTDGFYIDGVNYP